MEKYSYMQLMIREEINFVLENDVEPQDRKWLTEQDKKRLENHFLDTMYLVIDRMILDELENIIEDRKERKELR